VPPLSLFGPVWKEWHDAVVQAESRVLRQLGFTLYWVPDHHPHLFLHHFVQALTTGCEESDDAKTLTTTAYRYCNVASRLDLCVRLAPEVICCAAIYCAALEHNYELPATATSSTDDDGRSWWQIFCGSGLLLDDQDLSDAVNAILGMDDDNNGTNPDVVIASKAFIKSRLSPNGTSFNDPDSFVWEMLIEPMGVATSKS
jgi:hypothetical protein